MNNSSIFSNKKIPQISSSTVRSDIKKIINNIGTFNLTGKYYTFLNRKNVNVLKELNLKTSLSTFGKKYILFLISYKNKDYNIFINKKNEEMLMTNIKFNSSDNIDSIELYKGTLFDGELVKNSNGEWIYIINDISYYGGNNIITDDFDKRQLIIDDILKNNYSHNTNNTCIIEKKRYYGLEYIEDLVNKVIPSINYKCSGLYFKNTTNYSDNYLFIFPECRSDSKILLNYNVITGEITDKKPDRIINGNSGNSCNSSNLGNSGNSGKSDKSDKSGNSAKSDEIISNKNTCNFLVRSTILPDIYELYCLSNNNNYEKYGHACIADIKTSIFMNTIMPTKNSDDVLELDIKESIKKGEMLYFECNYYWIFSGLN